MTKKTQKISAQIHKLRKEVYYLVLSSPVFSSDTEKKVWVDMIPLMDETQLMQTKKTLEDAVEEKKEMDKKRIAYLEEKMEELHLLEREAHAAVRKEKERRSKAAEEEKEIKELEAEIFVS